MIRSRDRGEGKLRILLIKPYQPVTLPIASPPLGILYLASTLRKQFGDRVEVRVNDHWLDKRRYTDLHEELAEFQPHVVGLSALNFEAEESGRIADLVRQVLPETKLALGGPFAHGKTNLQKIIDTGLYDWVFDGEADWSFPIVVQRWHDGDETLDDIAGLTWRNGEQYVTNGTAALPDKTLPNGKAATGLVGELDEIPFPAWDLVDFDAYARRINNNGNLRGKRYAPIFTSRGCPFLCTYCHDIFGKKFHGRSPENVLAEVKLLREQHSIDELQIVDDIFNMNSRRMKEICRGLAEHDMFICFPNGLRGDILDEEGVQALVDAGMYEVAVAIETVTPRLQDLIKKRLRLKQLLQAIDWMAERGVMVKGFFMLGFPTETPEEMQETVDFAVNSKLTHAVFNLVTPQPGTPMYHSAYEENAEALNKVLLHDYYAATCWYSEAYGLDMHKVRSRAYFRFYLSSPGRMLRLLKHMSPKDLFRGFYYWAQKVFVRTNSDEGLEEALPDSMQSLRKIYSTKVEPEFQRQVRQQSLSVLVRVMDTIRIGIVGLGGNARLRHVEGFRNCEDVEIFGVCNRRRESTAAAAEEFDIPRTYRHWEELVADPSIDAVLIGTWPYLHCPITLAALESGKHVLTEARMAMNANEAHRMLEASRKHPELVCQIVPSPFGLRAHRVVGQLLRSGFLGELREVVVLGTSDALADHDVPLEWRQVGGLSGLNMLTMGIVYETLARWVPDVVRVTAQGHAFVPDRLDPNTGVRSRVGTPDSLQIFTVHEGGARGLYHFSGVTRFGPGTQIHLYGSKGTLKYEMLPHDRLMGAQRGEDALREIPVPQEHEMQWRVEEEFIDAIRGEGRVELTDFESGVRYMEFTEAVARSISSGKPISLPLELGEVSEGA
ncbi:Uncharacterized methyltransferase PH0819 [Durusdinium trenchii]|uniref:Uncharacterized methyltransferase PH0819 n=1 Tax=Durusdinium trenchii TaxID=1381693 RepID=A0ABP0JE00_9DINO